MDKLIIISNFGVIHIFALIKSWPLSGCISVHTCMSHTTMTSICLRKCCVSQGSCLMTHLWEKSSLL